MNGTSFAEAERLRAVAWKETTATLPESARLPAPYVGKSGVSGPVPYPFCLPAEHARLNLLPEVREACLALFRELGVPWHAGVDDGPSNHLLSSQVQCVNALGQMVSDPGRIRAAFGDVLDLAGVETVEPGRYLTFEYIGPEDYFGEGAGKPRTRGAHCTSVDAAFAYRDGAGALHLALVEWKYTESYRRRTPEPARDEVRRSRYEFDVLADDGPIDASQLKFEALLDEPFYQLMRQQLLASRIERDERNEFQTVRVLHVLDPANDAYAASVHGAAAQQLGTTVEEVWGRLLRHSDRFVHVDPRIFWRPDVTSQEYCSRYARRKARHTMLIDDLPEDVRRSFLAAYDLTGHDAGGPAGGRDDPGRGGGGVNGPASVHSRAVTRRRRRTSAAVPAADRCLLRRLNRSCWACSTHLRSLSVSPTTVVRSRGCARLTTGAPTNGVPVVSQVGVTDVDYGTTSAEV